MIFDVYLLFLCQTIQKNNQIKTTMIVISPTEFRNNFKKYFDVADKERVIIQRGTAEIFELVKRERIEDPYFDNPENVKALKKSLKQAKEGKVKKLTTIADLLDKSSF